MFLLSSLKFWMLALVKVCDWMWSWHLGVKPRKLQQFYIQCCMLSLPEFCASNPKVLCCKVR